MARWLDNVRENSTSVGTGSMTLNGAVATYRTFAAAGAVAGDLFNYRIDDVGGAWELGQGVYNPGSPGTLTRSLKSSSTGALLNLSGQSTVEIAVVADDLNFATAASLVF